MLLFLKVFFTEFIAEMGDKTQLMLIALTSKYKLRDIILGTAANGILAVTHKFPAIFMTFFNIFQLAWHETGAIHYFDEDRDVFFSQTIEKIKSVCGSGR